MDMGLRAGLEKGGGCTVTGVEDGECYRCRERSRTLGPPGSAAAATVATLGCDMSRSAAHVSRAPSPLVRGTRCSETKQQHLPARCVLRGCQPRRRKSEVRVEDSATKIYSVCCCLSRLASELRAVAREIGRGPCATPDRPFHLEYPHPRRGIYTVSLLPLLPYRVLLYHHRYRTITILCLQFHLTTYVH